MKVGRNVFWPAPNVDSALVYLDRTMPVTTSASQRDVFAVIDAAFAQRRKTLRQALAGIAGNSQRASTILEAAGVPQQHEENNSPSTTSPASPRR